MTGTTTIADGMQMSQAAVESKRTDMYIWGIYIAICFVSVIELYSASSHEVSASRLGVYGPILRHVGMLIGGTLIMLGLQRVHYRKFIWPIMGAVIFSALAMVYVMYFGEYINGARRAFTVFGITVQPSELIKLSAAAIVAFIMSRAQVRGGGVTVNGVAWTVAIISLFGILLVKQGMTNTLLLMSISLSMMIVGGVKWSHFFAVIMVYLAVLTIVVLATHRSSDAPSEQSIATEQTVAWDASQGHERSSTWRARIDRFFDPTPKYEREIVAENRQEMYSYMAQAHGGVIGVAPGNSRETARLPLAFSDYIYSIIIEECGLVGGLVVLCLYLMLLGRAFIIASRCTRAFPALLVIGMAVMIVFQALFHMAIVTGVFPVSGQPLPLISKGGTSILVTSTALGVMLSVARSAVRRGAKRQEQRAEMDSLPEDFRADNPTLIS